MKQKLLIIEDDIQLNALLKDFFESSYLIQQAFDGEEGLSVFYRNPPDIILLDIMMPKKNGIDVLKKIRQTSKTPVIMLTAMGEDIDKIMGLELGADDYVVKPCNPRELAARIKNLLTHPTLAMQRATKPQESLNIDCLERKAFIYQQDLQLTSIEYEIFNWLVQYMPESVDKDELFKYVFHRERQPFERSLDVHISNIRKKISAIRTNKDQKKFSIQSIRGKGYRLHPKAHSND